VKINIRSMITFERLLATPASSKVSSAQGNPEVPRRPSRPRGGVPSAAGAVSEPH
jgi:hypothetical protein